VEPVAATEPAAEPAAAAEPVAATESVAAAEPISLAVAEPAAVSVTGAEPDVATEPDGATEPVVTTPFGTSVTTTAEAAEPAADPVAVAGPTFTDLSSPLTSSHVPAPAMTRSTITTKMINPQGRPTTIGIDCEGLDLMARFAMALPAAPAGIAGGRLDIGAIDPGWTGACGYGAVEAWPSGATWLWALFAPLNGALGTFGRPAGASGASSETLAVGARRDATAPAIRAPQPPQKRESGAFSVPQLGQRIEVTA
jgi:hypothetical protein